MTLRVGLVQFNAGPDLETNLDAVAALVREAAGQGARFILTPENVGAMRQGRERVLAAARPEAEHPGPPAFSALARDTGTWLLAGSFAVKVGDERLANRSYLFAPDGSVAARYDKIHLFDFEGPAGETYRESATYVAGDRAVVADTPFGRVGLTICYDVRFAGLYRALAKAGASIITVPAAFTVPTGQAHWHVLLRARAIETGAFVLAPAQTGVHEQGRRTFGHSLVVAPWGEVLADGGEEVGVVTADLDFAAVETARRQLQSLRHDRPFALPD